MATTEEFAASDNQLSDLLEAVYAFAGRFVA